MEKNSSERKIGKKTVWVNVLIICAVAFIGIWIIYIAMAIFTKHGEHASVPGVENMTYTRAIEILHSKGFNVDIRDSIYRDDVKPGYVIEQFPKANSVVKPGRKIFLYINAVHPKEVVIDDGADKASLALKGLSFRQAKARLQELGFKNLAVITVLGSDDRVVKLTANGKPIFKMQKVPVNARIIIEISDGRLGALRDSLYESERRGIINYSLDDIDNFGEGGYGVGEGGAVEGGQQPEYFEEPDYFEIPDEDLLNQ